MAHLKVRPALATLLVVASLTMGGCGGPEAGGDAGTETVSQDVTWTSVKGFKVPAAADGPTNLTDTPPSGYARTDFGAALAAANLSIALDTANEGSFGVVLSRATVDDEGRRVWAAARAGLIIGQTQVDKVPELLAWAAGAGETEDAVTIFLYWRQYDGSLTEQRREMVWQAEDWKIQLPHNPQTPQLRAVTDVPAEAHTFTPPSA